MSRQEMLDALAAMGVDISTINDAVPDEMLAQMLAQLQPEPGAEPAPQDPNAVQQMADLTREDMVAGLLQNGHTQEELDAMGDEELKAMYEAEFPAATETPEGEPTPAPVEQMADLTPEEMVAALVEKGHSPEELAALSPEDLKALFDMEFPPEEAPPAAPAPEPAPVQQMSERRRKQAQRQPKQKFMVFSEKQIQDIVKKSVDGALATHRQAIQSVLKQASEHDRNYKRANIVKFCEALRNEGKLLPRQFNATVERLMRAEHKAKVHKFSETGLPATELELQMAELEQGPILTTFAERLRQPISNVDEDVKQVESHFESFAEDYRRVGMSKEKFVNGFKKARAADPRIRVDDYTKIR